jgi:hypothetical protein
MVYPGGNSCIRYEKLREGIVDFEKIRILKKDAAESKDKSIQDLWKQFEQHLKIFAVEKEFNQQKITGDVDKGRAMVEQLTDKLAGRK